MNPLLISIPEELFAGAESLSFSGKVDFPSLVQDASTYRFTDPVEWNVAVTNTGDALLVSGTVKGRALTACARCLEDVSYDFEGEVEGYFLIPGSDRELTDEEKSEYGVLGEDRTIDLEPLLQAALVLEFPYTPLCDEDCKGLCPSCGADLNKETCTCSVDDDTDDSNPFSVLKNYRFDD